MKDFAERIGIIFATGRYLNIWASIFFSLSFNRKVNREILTDQPLGEIQN